MDVKWRDRVPPARADVEKRIAEVALGLAAAPDISRRLRGAFAIPTSRATPSGGPQDRVEDAFDQVTLGVENLHYHLETLVDELLRPWHLHGHDWHRHRHDVSPP